MNILIATFTFWPEANGVAHVAFAQARRLADLGHKVEVVTCPSPGRDTGRLAQSGVTVREFDVRGNANTFVGFCGEIEAYREYVHASTSDVVLFHCWQAWPTDLGVGAVKSPGPRKVLVSHGVSANALLSVRNIRSWLGWRPYLRRMRRMLAQFDHVVFLTDCKDKRFFYDRWLVDRVGKAEYSIIPNGGGPNPSWVGSTLRDGPATIPLRPVLLNVGSFDWRKNQALCLEVLHQCRDVAGSLVLIGNAPNDYSSEIERSAERLDLRDRVILRYNLSRGEIWRAYETADLYLCTSRWEAQPLSVLDAMAAGVPFASLEVGCVDELPGGVTVRAPRSLVQDVRALLDDPQRRAALGRVGRAACVDTYSWEANWRRYAALLGSLERSQDTPADSSPECLANRAREVAD